MTLIERWCAGWLRASGWTMFAPGEPLPECPPPTCREATERLLRAGCTVLLPGEVLLFDRDQAIEQLKALGYGVVRPLQPPAVGSVWVPHPPTDAKRKPPLHATLSRTVIAADNLHVKYELGGYERPPVTLSGWYQWRRDMQAKVQEPPAP